MNRLLARLLALARHERVLELGKDVAVMAVFVAAAVILFQDALFHGKIFYEYDTSEYYFPIAARIGQALHQGELPTWTTYLFGGFPLFADGETSMLSPLNLVGLALLPLGQAYVLAYILRFVLGAAFTYAFARTIRLDRLSALVTALVFSGGSFMIGQMHHLNVTGAAIWLPLILCFAEKAYRSRGLTRINYLVFAGVAAGIQVLTFHVNPVFMTSLCLGTYVLFRAFVAPDIPGERRRDWGSACRFTALAGIIVPVTAAALAAVQLLPTWELGTLSVRAGAETWDSASSYSIAPVNLITLFVPYFFRAVPGYSGMLWAFWETTLYVGIPTLVLVPVALLFRRCRYTVFFAILGLISLFLAFGDYSPIGLYWLLWQVPGMSAMRVPGRFAFLFVLSCAVLAGLGMGWLRSTLSKRPASGANPETRRVGIWLAACGGGGVLLLAGFSVARWWIIAHPDESMSLLKGSYLSLRSSWNLLPDAVMRSITRALDVQNPTTAWSFLVLFASLGMLALWHRFRRLRWIWQSGLVILLGADLLVFASYFHPSRRADEFSIPSAAIAFLRQHDGLHRVYATWPRAAIVPNGLLQFQVSTASGYSSLEPARHRNYARFAEYRGGVFLDLWNARYRVVKNQPSSLWKKDDVEYDALRPLISGQASNPNSRASVDVSQSHSDEVRIISALRNGEHVRQGVIVGEVLVTGADGQRVTLPLRAGLQTADVAFDRPYAGPFSHQRPGSSFSLKQWSPLGSQALNTLYTARLPLPSQMAVTTVEVHGLSRTASLEVYGLAVRDSDTGAIEQLRSRRGEKLVYQDKDVLIYERDSYLPRTFVDSDVKIVDSDAEALDWMAEGPFDPTRVVVLTRDADDRAAADVDRAVRPTFVSLGSAIEKDSGARITAYLPEQVSIVSSADRGGYLVLTDSYYPGWRAFVDGKETRIYRADYLFRAVRIPPGQHTVVFVYDPGTLKAGKWISVVSGLGIILFLLVPLGRRRMTA